MYLVFDWHRFRNVSLWSTQMHKHKSLQSYMMRLGTDATMFDWFDWHFTGSFEPFAKFSNHTKLNDKHDICSQSVSNIYDVWLLFLVKFDSIFFSSFAVLSLPPIVFTLFIILFYFLLLCVCVLNRVSCGMRLSFADFERLEKVCRWHGMHELQIPWPCYGRCVHDPKF